MMMIFSDQIYIICLPIRQVMQKHNFFNGSFWLLFYAEGANMEEKNNALKNFALQISSKQLKTNCYKIFF